MQKARSARPVGWIGALELGEHWAVWRGAVGEGATHRHFAAQAVLAPEPIDVVDGDGRCLSSTCILVEPFARHCLKPAPIATLVYIEPSIGVPQELEVALAPVREESAGALVGPAASGFWSRWLTNAPPQPLRPDPRILLAKDFAEAALCRGAVSVAAAAQQTGLSPDRFRHLFAEHAGLPFRRWLLWRRLRLAVAELLKGSDVTTAAHAAGFADAAHFARTLKAMFGVTAGQTLLA